MLALELISVPIIRAEKEKRRPRSGFGTDDGWIAGGGEKRGECVLSFANMQYANHNSCALVRISDIFLFANSRFRQFIVFCVYDLL